MFPTHDDETVMNGPPKICGSTLAGITTQREAQSRADLIHPGGVELRDTLAQAIHGDCNDVVQVDCARRLHAIFFAQDNFRSNAANRGCNRGDGDG